MKANNVVLLLLAAMAACNGQRSPQTAATNTSPKNTNATPQGECGNGPCEHVAYMKKYADPNSSGMLSLSEREHASLAAALARPQATGNADAHIHADVANNALVFSTDNAADQTSSHISGNEPEVSLTNGGVARKIVASPAAQQLFERRMIRQR